MTGELKAGLFVLAALGTLVYMTTRLTQNRFSFSGTKVYYANVNDATGLLMKTKVKMAGLDVGQLVNLELSGKRARVTMEIAADMVIHKDAVVTVKNIGFLGDKYLELHAGSETSPAIEERGYINEGVASGNFDQLTAKTTELVDNLKEITTLLKEALKGSGGTGDGSRLDRILDNMEQFSQGLAEMDRLGDLADRLTEIADNVKDVTGKVNRGEGTIGKLLTDTETIDKLNETLSGVNKFVTKADKLQLYVDARTGVLTNYGGSRSVFSLYLQPSYDKYYLVGVATRPQGVTTSSKTFTTPNADSPGATTTVEEKKVNDESGLGINVQFAKRLGDFTFRLGLFETTGGIGVDYTLWDERMTLTSEFYRFRRKENPQVNLSATVNVYRPFYLWGGGDYLLTKDFRSGFIGAGLRFSDQDLKTFFGTAAMAASR